MRDPANNRTLFLLLLCIVGGFLWFQLGNWNNVIYRPESEYSDLAITFWPNIAYIQNSIRDYHQLPLWRTLIFSGSPIDVDPQSGLWYPPNFIFLFLPATLGFNVLVLFHLVMAGYGMWLWSRDTGISKSGSVLSSLAYVFAPKIAAHLGFGHMGLVYASAYIPWALWASFKIGSGEKRGIYALGLVLGLQFIANPQMCFYTGLVSVLYGGYTGWETSKREQQIGKIVTIFARLGFGATLGVFISAAQLLAMLRFAPLSGRSGMGLSDSAISSVPFQYLWGILVADHRGYMEYMMYFGITVLVLAVFTLFKRESRFWWVFIILSVLFALGTNTPFYGLVFRILPALAWVRSPARILFLTACALGLLAGSGFDLLVEGINHRHVRILRIAVFGLGAFAFVLLIGYAIMADTPPANMLAFGLLTPAITAFCLLLSSRKLSPRIALPVVTLLVLLDLWIMDGTLIEGRSSAQALKETGLGAYLAEKKKDGYFRVYSPSYSLPRQIGAIYGIESADGVDPLYLAEYDRYMQAASGITRHRYEVTIPAMEGDEPVSTVNREAVPNIRLLGLLNVRYIATEFPLDMEGLRVLHQFEKTYLFENIFFNERAFFTGEVVPVKDLEEAIIRIMNMDDFQTATVEGGQPLHNGNVAADIHWRMNSPNKIELNVENSQKGLLIISHIWYPDWKATVDGQPVILWKANGVLSGIYLDPGSHSVTLNYIPWLTYAGIAISLVMTVVILIKLLVFDKRELA